MDKNICKADQIAKCKDPNQYLDSSVLLNNNKIQRPGVDKISNYTASNFQVGVFKYNEGIEDIFMTVIMMQNWIRDTEDMKVNDLHWKLG